MLDERRFYTYVLFRPWNGVPCYVGKGSGKRAQEHVALGEKHYNARLACIIAKSKRLDLEIPIVKIRENLTDAEAIETEIAFIAAIGQGKKGPLVNMTAGGDGLSGYHHTVEARKKMGVRKGKKHSEETKEKLRAINTGRTLSMETKAKISAALTGIQRPLEVVAKIRAAQVGRKLSPEHVAKLSASHKGTVLSLEHRARIGLAHVGRKNSEETRAKMRVAALSREARKRQLTLEVNHGVLATNSAGNP